MKYINSTETETIDGKEYLHLYLNPKYGFDVKINGEEMLVNEIFIQAPTMSTMDVGDVRKVSTVISKFEDIYNQDLQRQLLRLSEEDKIKLFSIAQEPEKILEKVDPKLAVREHIGSILQISKSYESENSNFFTEFDKITYFLQKRLNRKLDDSLVKIDFSVFDKHLGLKQFILEEIFIEYVSFFFKHFPLESLLRASKE